ncbi:MAG: hypothetical protein OHK93_005471 [Ramalina farinacea]|uniref:Methyltransferase domain-containing protein n=1 Tax=Ramalina farinacea TaxID=258253 RepID=A0AA43QL02_9LECA|nr:hypothetical protein [Ramalina farinacea]
MGVDDYTLERGYRASARLNLQHHLCSETIGYYLHPSIPSAKEQLAIADVGTGTGIWLLGLQQHLPHPIVYMYGLDISGDQFPRPEWIPSNIHFREHDAFDPAGPPDDLLGAFDVVHIRLFVSVIKNNNPTKLLDYCHKLLKPDGYLQWDELDPPRNQIASGVDPSASAEGMDMISRMIRTQKPTDWVAHLPDTFAQCGFEVADVDLKTILPWQRGMYIDIYCMLADEFVERANRGGEGIKPVEDYYAEMPAKASAEGKHGAYIELTFQIVVGKKI